MSNQIFLFYGDEDYLITQRIKEFKVKIENPDLNIETFDGDEAEAEKIVSALQAQSLLGGQKLVIVRKVDAKSELCSSLIPYLKAIAPGTQVIFRAVKADRRSKFYKLIDQIGEVYEFKSFAPWEQDQVVSWIKRQARSLGKEIKHEAAEKMREICGSDLQKLSSEMDKIITYAGEKKTIEEEDVLALASPGEVSVFALSDAVADKDLKKALSAFSVLWKNKVELFSLLSLLAKQFRVMLLAKYESNAQNIAQSVGASPYYVKKCVQKAAKFKEEELKRNLELLLETDLKLKTGEQQVPVVELLLASLCGS